MYSPKIWKHFAKVQFFWEGHKNLKKNSHLFWRYWVKTAVLSNQGGDFFPILLPSHNTLTLPLVGGKKLSFFFLILSWIKNPYKKFQQSQSHARYLPFIVKRVIHIIFHWPANWWNAVWAFWVSLSCSPGTFL